MEDKVFEELAEKLGKAFNEGCNNTPLGTRKDGNPLTEGPRGVAEYSFEDGSIKEVKFYGSDMPS